ncbi:transmembrane protein [Ditylenchus destructor]|uniref:Transmembrane protein 208 n=1 Tax=Ditylenchus destructor TaxID=166010 RepID=A0AAD4N5N9_9BILA|nr:transmembrane protein [Ditylenchus destructor]
MQKGKQAVRGQKQIYEENRSTIFYYSLASVCTAALVACLNVTIFTGTTGLWTGWVISCSLQIFSIAAMCFMVKSVRNERNHIVDAGIDLNDPQTFGEYCKDIIILCCLAHLLSIAWAHFYCILLTLPIFAMYKLWVGFLGPWFFAPAEEKDDSQDKKQRRREKKVFVRH